MKMIIEYTHPGFWIWISSILFFIGLDIYTMYNWFQKEGLIIIKSLIPLLITVMVYLETIKLIPFNETQLFLMNTLLFVLISSLFFVINRYYIKDWSDTSCTNV